MVKNMVEYKVYGGRALRIAIGIIVLTVLLMVGGVGAALVPQITSISPTQIVGSTFDLTINGNNFDTGAIDQIYWKANGNFIGQGVIISRTSTKIVSRQSMTNIAAGIYSVKVKNSDGQYSSGADLTITAPAPQITSISPTQIVGSTFDLTINGNNFDTGAIDQIYWKANGNFIGQGVIISRTSTKIVSRQSMTNIAAGIYSVKVKNSDGQYSSGVDLTITAPVPPNLPTSLSQYKSDGTTGIPLGGTTSESTVVMKGGVSDPDGSSVLLEVEIRPVGTVFTNTPTCSGSNVPSGGTASSTCSGLTSGQYHWQARASEGTSGLKGPWLSGGGNPESSPDFTVDTNQPPYLPTSLSQYKSDGTTGIPLGGATSESTVVMKGGVSDPNSNSVLLEVEIRPVGTVFTNTPTCSGSNVPSGGTASSTCSGLTDGQYHWQARASEGTSGLKGPWLSGGGNPESSPDFIVSTQVSEKSLLRVDSMIEVYWLQNKKLYWVTDAAMTPMSGIPGWGWSNVKVYPSSVFNPASYVNGPRFINADASSDNLLIQEYGTINVYLISNGKKRHIVSPEVFESKGYNWSDVIDVSSQILNLFPIGSDISNPPSVTITAPADGSTVTTSTVTVSGTATDDIDVTSLTVNGNAVTLTSGSFSTTVNLGSGVNTITVTAKDAGDNSKTATVTVTYVPNQISEKSLLRVDGQNEVYWLQNNKLYWITDWDVITKMSEIPGWGSVNVLPASLFKPAAYSQGPRFINTEAISNDLLIQEKGKIEVYLISGGKRHHIVSEEVFLSKGYKFADIIEVSSQILQIFPIGSDISNPSSVTNLANYPSSPKDIDTVNLYADVTSDVPISSVSAQWSTDHVNWNIIDMIVYSGNTYITS